MFFLSISESVLIFISGIGVLQGILLAIFIYFHTKSDHTVNKFLAFYIACLSIIMAGPLLLQVISWKDGSFVGPFPVLVGPLLYFYVRSFKESITWRKAFPHLILFILYIFFSYWFVKYLADKYPDEKNFPKEGFSSVTALIYFSIRYIQSVAYYFLSIRELKLYQKSIQHLFSETSHINLQWVRLLVNGYIIILILSIIIYSLMAKYPDNFYLLYLINIAIATPYIYMATYKGITQSTIWQKVAEEDKEKLELQLNETKAAGKNSNSRQQGQKQGLGDGRMQEIISRLTEVMTNDKFYQEPELTLQDISDKLNYPAHQVSQAINEGLKKSFYDLVNGYRVEEAKRLLLDPKNKNYTVLSIGFEAGFNSKTTFNTVFKKFTGQTPTDYREKQQAASVIA
jgi:AraC-like DNA-binding protein